MAMAAVMAIGSLVAGGASSIMSSRTAKKNARRAAEEAKRLREWYEGKARDTQARLGREIETMRTLRDLDMPAHRQAAQIAQIQQRKGYEMASRARQVGRLGADQRQAIFGGQAQQYFQQQAQDFERYVGLSREIFSMSNAAQEQVNQLLTAGGAQYGQMQGTAQRMRYEAGSPLGKALGAVAQGMSMAASGMQAEQQQAKWMAHQKELAGMGGGTAADPEAWKRLSSGDVYGPASQRTMTGDLFGHASNPAIPGGLPGAMPRWQLYANAGMGRR